jgi:hypothetical protein
VAAKKQPEPADEPEPKKAAAPTPSPGADGNDAAPGSGDLTPYRAGPPSAPSSRRPSRPTDHPHQGRHAAQALQAVPRQKHRDIRKKIGGKAGIAGRRLPALRQVDAETFNQTGKLMEERTRGSAVGRERRGAGRRRSAIAAAGLRRSGQGRRRPRRDPKAGVAAVLSFLIPGAGQIYTAASCAASSGSW